MIEASPRRKLSAAADPDRLSDAYSLAICIVRPIMIDCIVTLTTKMEDDGDDDGGGGLRNRIDDEKEDGVGVGQHKKEGLGTRKDEEQEKDDGSRRKTTMGIAQHN